MTIINALGNSLTGTSGAASFVGRDANANTTVNSYIPGSATTVVTGSGATTLTVASTQVQIFTGTGVSHSVVLPVVSTLSIGQSYRVINQSNLDIPIESSGLNNVYTVLAGFDATFTCISLTGTTAASWATSSATTAPAVLLTPTADQTITAHNLIMSATSGSFIAPVIQAGLSTGTTALPFVIAYSQAGNLGSLVMYTTAMAGNFEGDITNASLTNDRTWTLPDATGTVLLSSTIGSTAVLLSPSASQTITAYDLSLATGQFRATTGGFIAGSGAGSAGSSFTSYSPTAAKGTLSMQASDSSLAFDGLITNASISADRTWTLPDATGNLLVDTQAILTNPAGNQTILGTYSLIMDQGSYYATAGNFYSPAGYFFSGDGAIGGIAGTYVAYSPTANLGALQIVAVDSAANNIGTLSNSNLSADRTWSLPDATGTIALTSSLPITWNTNSGTSFTAAVANGYILSHVGAVTVTLPTTFAAGTQIGVAGGVSGNSWTISIPGGTNVSAYGASYTTSVASTAYSDNIILLATVANTSWTLLDTSSTALTFI